MILFFAIYNILLIPIGFIIKTILKLFNSKLGDRESNFKKSLESLSNLNRSNKIAWFHSSSMGEFEQAKPVIEKLLENSNNISVVVSFYSPSGYNNQRNYKFADSVVYMPYDSYFSAKSFIKSISPDIAVFVRYDYWFNHLFILKNLNIPAILINATVPIKKGNIYNYYYKQIFQMFKVIYTGGKSHFAFFKDILPSSNVVSSTDTRFDRILGKVSEKKDGPIINKSLFNKSSIILIVGSCWEPDEDLLIGPIADIRKSNLKISVLWVPHEPTKEHLIKLQAKLPKPVLMSEVNESKLVAIDDLIVDSIGKLLSLYSIADIAYVGGGYGVGVHSLAEPAGYGIPLACGPNHISSNDAIELKEIGALEIINDKNQALNWLNMVITDPELRKNKGLKAKNYIEENAGSTEIISNDIRNILLRNHKPTS